MSGIVGGAGSKSGVIGTTELDYEEGTWTPAFNRQFGGEITATQDNYAEYVKVGNLVTLSVNITLSSVTDSGSGYTWIGGAPFAPASAYLSSGVVHGNTAFTTTVVESVVMGSSQILFHETGAQRIAGGSHLGVAWMAGNFQMTLSYFT